jgi:aconitate hydratase
VHRAVEAKRKRSRAPQYDRYNRNFRGRNDGNPETLAFVGSAELVTAAAAAGRLSFDPARDELADSQGRGFMLLPPEGDDLPSSGFCAGGEGFVAPPQDAAQRRRVQVVINPESERLEFLPQFAAWEGRDLGDLELLVKVRGKCTTDQISPAGRWLKYRGHLSRICGNLLQGAVNAFDGETGRGLNALSGQRGSLAEVAQQYRSAGAGWIIVGDENYGEGSSREHAALEPRHLGCRAVIVRSFARIHEANLKKQGVLALRFASPGDYDLILEKDRFDITGLLALEPGSELVLRVRRAGAVLQIKLLHSMTAEEIEWFKAGSALNCMRRRHRRS